jgi:hypothetical protein
MQALAAAPQEVSVCMFLRMVGEAQSSQGGVTGSQGAQGAPQTVAPACMF